MDANGVSLRGFARLMAEAGEPCTGAAVQDWRDGKALPGGRFIEPIEDLLERRWRDLTTRRR